MVTEVTTPRRTARRHLKERDLRFGVIIRTALLTCFATGAAFWLFSDTISHYMPTDRTTPLRVSFWGPYEEFEMWKEMLAAFQAKHPGIEVRAEYVPSRYEQKIQQLFVADNAPDVILYQDEPYPNIIKSEKFEDLTPYLERDRASMGLDPNLDLYEALKRKFWPTAVESFYYDRDGRTQGPRRVFGLPIWGGCNLLYYNKECFARSGIRVASLPSRFSPDDPNGPGGLAKDPNGGWILDDERWTIDDFVQVCRALTVDFDGDGRIDQFGYSLGWWGYYQPFIMTMEADILDKDLRRTTFYGPKVEKCLKLFQDMLYGYRVSPTPAELSQIGQGVGFYTGRVAIFNSGPWEMPFCNATGVGYDILHIPRNPLTRVRATRITWDAVNMFSGSKKKEQAWLLIRFLLSPEAQRIVAKVQRSIPALQEAKGAFISQNPRVRADKFVRVAGEYGRMQPITEYWDQMARACGDAFTELTNTESAKRLTPAEAIGLFLSDKKLMSVLPPADPAAAEKYRKAYENRKK